MFSLVALLLSAAPASSPVRLLYVATDTQCPAKERLISAVVARLGTVPFADDATETVEVRVLRSGEALTAQVSRYGPAGESGRRELSSPTLDCSELFRALELAVAIAIDPRAGLVRPAVKAAPAPLPVPTHVEEREPPAAPTLFHLGLGVSGSYGTGPTATAGFVVFAGLKHRQLEVSLGGRVELPAGLAVGSGHLGTQLMLGDLAACMAISAFRACGTGQLGALRMSSEGLLPGVQQTSLVASAGARLALVFSLSEHWALRPFVEVTASLTRLTVVSEGTPVWASAPVAGNAGLALVLKSGD